MTSPCRAVGRFVESFLDGELDPSQVLEVEKHTQSCVTCRERVALDGAIRAGVRRTVAASNPSPNFRSRVSSSMLAQRWAAESASASGALATWGTWVVGLAAAVAAVVGIQGRGRQQDAEDAVRAREASIGTHVGLDAMIDQFVDWHARPLPPEITNP